MVCRCGVPLRLIQVLGDSSGLGVNDLPLRLPGLAELFFPVDLRHPAVFTFQEIIPTVHGGRLLGSGNRTGHLHGGGGETGLHARAGGAGLPRPSTGRNAPEPQSFIEHCGKKRYNQHKLFYR